jgi:hypothetical protein
MSRGPRRERAMVARQARSFTFEPPHARREEKLVLQAHVVQGGVCTPLLDLLFHLTCRTSGRSLSGAESLLARYF